MLTFYSIHPSALSLASVFNSRRLTLHSCPPRLWSAGQWLPIPPRAHPNVTSPADVLALHGFQGCASDREYNWHIGAEVDQYDRFPDVTSYEWTPPNECNVRPLDREQLVKELVEDGGWLLIGGKSRSKLSSRIRLVAISSRSRAFFQLFW